MSLDPHIIKSYQSSQFSKASKSYDQVAHVQDVMAKQLLACLLSKLEMDSAEQLSRSNSLKHTSIFGSTLQGNDAIGPIKSSHQNMPYTSNRYVLELGAGTGICTASLLRHLAPHFSHYIVSDLSFQMMQANRCLAQVQGRAVMDACVPALKRAHLVVSNAMVQWIPNLTDHFSSIYSLLEPGCIYVCTGFGSKNLFPLYEELAQVGVSRKYQPMHSLEQIEDSATLSGLNLLRYTEWFYEQEFSSVLSLLQQIKMLGAGGSPEGIKISRKQIQALEKNWSFLSPTGQVRARWQPWLGVFQKPLAEVSNPKNK